MAIYTGVDGVNRKISQQDCGIDGINREILEQWRGVDGVNRLVFSSGMDYIYNLGNVLKPLMSQTSVGDTFPNIVPPNFNSTDITLNINTVNTASGVTTSDVIDLTNYSKIVVESTANFTLSSADNYAFTITTQKTNVHTSYVKRNNVAINSGVKTLTEFDISDLSGNYYFNIYVIIASTVIDRTVKIHRIYLQK